jgi:GNAT superfamily N-acetyltransferase
MGVTIRMADCKDFPAILTLIKEFALFQKTPEKVAISLEQMVNEADYFKCLVAETENKELIGFASFFFAYYSWTGKALYLDDLYVTDPFRKRGIGKLLLEAVIYLAKEKGCKKIRWQVSKWNENAIAFYKGIGATVDDIEINCDLNIQDS